ncbi:MAG: hypothetical protein KME45_21170 [Stenomitos rutilans HA7619-LM2]|jgi:hypothetical protein|nr:hypothetical protein [Stenomitos rutilans HA7619-LM2]
MEEKKGIPIYLDEAKRKFANSALEEVEITAWHPSNPPAINLWRCFEALEDIANLLKGTAILSNDEERRRRTKILVIPLYSLCVAIRDLCNYLNSALEMRNQFNKVQRAEINKTLEDFLKVVPLDKTSAIRSVRDQLSAHVDKLMPYEAKTIFDRAKNHEIGAWLHQCILTLSQLLPLDVYGWTTDDCPEGYFRVMSVEPWLVTFKLENDKPTMIAGLHIATSPKKLILKTCNKVLETSRWMFREGDQYVISLSEETINSEESV